MDRLTDHPLVAGHRSGVGFLGAVVLDPERIAADPNFPVKAYLACRERGLISRAIGGGALQISSSLVLTDAEFDELVTTMRATLDSLS